MGLSLLLWLWKRHVNIPRVSLPNIIFSSNTLWAIGDYALDLALVNSKKALLEKGMFGSGTRCTAESPTSGEWVSLQKASSRIWTRTRHPYFPVGPMRACVPYMHAHKSTFSKGSHAAVIPILPLSTSSSAVKLGFLLFTIWRWIKRGNTKRSQARPLQSHFKASSSAVMGAPTLIDDPPLISQLSKTKSHFLL